MPASAGMAILRLRVSGIPADAGMIFKPWIPAFAGMTTKKTCHPRGICPSLLQAGAGVQDVQTIPALAESRHSRGGTCTSML